MRIGIESGEILADETDTTFATGLAINAAARLQQAAEPGRGHARPRCRAADPRHRRGDAARGAGSTRLPGGGRGVARRLGLRGESAAGSSSRCRSSGARKSSSCSTTRSPAPCATSARISSPCSAAPASASRDSRESSSPASSARPSSPAAACPTGKGVTYWAVAEMVKVAAGITDDDSVDAATEKLRKCCGDEAVADLLALASGVLDAVGGERSASEIAWAAQTWATELADLQPLVLVFEDIHWAEEPMLDLIEHLASGRQGRAAADPLPRPRRPPRRAADVGWRQRARDVDRARGAAARGQRTARRRARGRRVAPSLSDDAARRGARARPRATRSSSRRRCGCCSSPTASRRASRTPSRR